MPVRPRGNRYEATVQMNKQRYRKLLPTKAEAQAWEAETKAKLLRGEPVETTLKARMSGAPATLEALMTLTHQRFWKGRSGEKAALVHANKCLAELGADLAPQEITEEAIDQMIFAFEMDEVSDSTINHRLAALSKMLTFAAERGYISRKPKIERKPPAQHRIRWIDEAEEATLLDFFAHDQDMVDFVTIGLDTGARVGEILRMTGQDVTNGYVNIWKGKTRTSVRSVPLTKRAGTVMAQRVAQFGKGRLFPEWTHSKVRSRWNNARTWMGLEEDPQFVPHAMRHTFCTRLALKGVDLMAIKELAGHASPVVTMRYTHLNRQHLTNAINALETA